MWSKNGKILEDNKGKYETESIITFDYCANFKWTTDLISGFGSIVDVNSGKESYNSNREMSCYASALTIKNVTLADLGEYKCNMSEHKGEESYYEKGSWVQNITLYNINDKTIVQPEKVEYFQKFHTKGMKENLLVQCVTTGGELKWHVNIHNNTECGDTYSRASCLHNSSIPLKELNSQDFWRCFNFSQNSHSPHEGITESFVYIDRACPLDYSRISCSVGDKEITHHAYISEKMSYENKDWHWDWEREHFMTISGFTVVPVVVALLIVSAIVAVIRSKMCDCCRGNAVIPTLFQFQPSVYSMQASAL